MGLEALDPRYPRVLPNIDRSSISDEIASTLTFDNDVFNPLDGFPNGIRSFWGLLE